MKYRNEIEIDVGRCFRALKNKYRLIIIMSLLFLLIGVACTLGKRENKYSAQATVYSVSSGSYTESKTGISAMNDYVDVATSYKVCQRAAYIIGDKNIDADVFIEDGLSQVGGGSMPLETIKTKVVAITPKNMSVSSLEKKLRLRNSHIIARIYDNKYILDVRTIFEEEFEIIANELKKVLN